MAEGSTRRTSDIAKAALYCALGAVLLLTLGLPFGFLHLDEMLGPMIVTSLLLGCAAFVLGSLAIFIISVRRKKLKGYLSAIAATLISAPFIFALLLSLLTTLARAERERAYSGSYNLRVLGDELARYADDHDGRLPTAENWCDLLLHHNEKLTKMNFRHPNPDFLHLTGTCHFALNRNLSGLRLADLPHDVVFLFEADGDWNLSGGPELLETRRSEHMYITIMFADRSTADYWFYENAVRKFDKSGRRMYYKELRWKP